MKVNFSAQILDIDNKPLKEGVKDVTLGSIVCTALLASYQDEQSISGEEKIKRFRLAELAVQGNEQDVKVEDIALIKQLIAKAFGPLIVGRTFDLIDPVFEASNAKE